MIWDSDDESDNDDTSQNVSDALVESEEEVLAKDWNGVDESEKKGIIKFRLYSLIEAFELIFLVLLVWEWLGKPGW